MSEGQSFELPIDGLLKQVSVGCSACRGYNVAPFTLAEFEERSGAFHAGWQVVLILTEVETPEGPARLLRWDVYCPDHALPSDNRPPGGLRFGS